MRKERYLRKPKGTTVNWTPRVKTHQKSVGFIGMLDSASTMIYVVTRCRLGSFMRAAQTLLRLLMFTESGRVPCPTNAAQR